MKIIEYSGCIYDNLTFDGVSEMDLQEGEREKIINSILKQLKKELDRGTIKLNSVIHLFPEDDYESDDEPCDQCGDYSRTTLWEIYETR